MPSGRERAASLLRDEFDWPNDEMGVRHSLAAVDALVESGFLGDRWGWAGSVHVPSGAVVSRRVDKPGWEPVFRKLADASATEPSESGPLPGPPVAEIRETAT